MLECGQHVMAEGIRLCKYESHLHFSTGHMPVSLPCKEIAIDANLP